jgi:putative redox protein
MAMEITFPGGVKVDVNYKGHTIRTDQPKQAGGDDSAPTPFDLFIASIGACAGYYALNFCRSRKISAKGMKVTLDTEYDADGKMISKVNIHVALPAGFPEQYKDAIVRAVESCTVKKHLQKPPKFEVNATV